jgi:hypothetical protein
VRKQVWIVRLVLLLVAGGLGAVAVEAHRTDDPGDPRTVEGLTGQRQAIEFEVNGDDEPRAFHTKLYLHCSGGDEWYLGWSPRDGAPVPFDWRDDRLRVREESRRHYEDGSSGTGVTTMNARALTRGVEGRIRAVWRFERPGGSTICDSGFVPFAVGPGASRRLDGIPRSAEPWSLYPDDAEPAVPRSRTQARFLARLDRTCMRTSRARPVDHAAHWAAARLGRPPRERAAHARWLGNFRLRVLVEEARLEALRRGDPAAAARRSAESAILEAHGNLDGLRLGLVTCTSNGPTGAPRS